MILSKCYALDLANPTSNRTQRFRPRHFAPCLAIWVLGVRLICSCLGGWMAALPSLPWLG